MIICFRRKFIKNCGLNRRPCPKSGVARHFLRISDIYAVIFRLAVIWFFRCCRSKIRYLSGASKKDWKRVKTRSIVSENSFDSP